MSFTSLAGHSLPGRLARLLPAVAWGASDGPEVHRHVEVANCSITTLRVLDGVRRLVRANEVGNLEWRGREGY